MEMQSVPLAIIAGVQLIVLALVQAGISASKERRDREARRLEKAEDYARQDLVAQRAAEASRSAHETSQAISRKIDEGLEQGRQIHILVNSDMTAARTAERDAMRLLVVALQQTRAANVRLGVEPASEVDDAIDKAKKRVEELNQMLADRLAAQQQVDREASQ